MEDRTTRHLKRSIDSLMNENNALKEEISRMSVPKTRDQTRGPDLNETASADTRANDVVPYRALVQVVTFDNSHTPVFFNVSSKHSIAKILKKYAAYCDCTADQLQVFGQPENANYNDLNAFDTLHRLTDSGFGMVIITKNTESG